MVNELLCFLQNNFVKFHRHVICTTIVGFYKEDEIVSGKNCLFGFADSLDDGKPDGLLRNIKRQVGDNKRKIDTDDIFALYSALDSAKVKLPVFAATNLSRIPAISPGEVDTVALSTAVASIVDQLNGLVGLVSSIESNLQIDMNARLDDVADGVQRQMSGVSDRLSALECKSDELLSLTAAKLDGDRKYEMAWPAITSASPRDAMNPVLQASKTVVPTMSAAVTDVRQKMPVQQARAPPKVVGSRSTSNIKGIPRAKRLFAFAGRLQLDTSSEDLRNFLEDAGLKDVKCTKLKQKEGMTFKTAAFCVSCSEESRHLFYDSSLWPQGVELRDWVFYN